MLHTELKAWKRSMDLVVQVYELTNDFPKKELYGLTSQLRRAIVSVPANISEGSATSSNKEYIRFLNMSLGSLAEVETLMIISNRLGYCKLNSELNISDVRKLISGTIRYLKTNN